MSYRELSPVLRLDRHPAGPRLYVAGRRVHHGSAGAIGALTLARRHPLLGAICVALLWHDRRDFPFRDCDNH